MKHKYILSLLVIGAAMTSCEQNETPVYDTDYSALNIWVGTASSVYDYTSYNYSYSTGEGSITFYARVMGQPVDYDRSFTLEAVDGDLQRAAGAYRTETYTVPAGEISTSGSIYFDASKLSDPDAFSEENDEGSITFRLAQNSEFVDGTYEMQSVTVLLRNFLAKPDDWDSASYPYKSLSSYFGTYSKVKYQFIIEVTGLVDFHISYYVTKVNYDEETNSVSTYYANYLKQILTKALNEYNDTHDTPLTDETGEVVTFN